MPNLIKRKDKGFRRDASQFFVAGELCRRGLIATVTLGNCPNTDILCSNPKGTKFVHIQVKTFRPGDHRCHVGMKSEVDYGNNFLWVLGGIPNPGSDMSFQYYIIPSKDMAKNIRECFRIWLETPGNKWRRHDPENKIRTIDLPPRTNLNGWSIDQYLNRWDLIDNLMN